MVRPDPPLMRLPHPRVMELFPPGGLRTLDDGRSVMTLPQFMLDPDANELLEVTFAPLATGFALILGSVSGSHGATLFAMSAVE